jgi:hypothetical protein
MYYTVHPKSQTNSNYIELSYFFFYYLPDVLVFCLYWLSTLMTVFVRLLNTYFVFLFITPHLRYRGHHGCDRMVNGVTTTYAISVSPLMLWVRIMLRWGVLDTTLCDKVVSDLQQVSDFLWVLWFPPQIKMTATI